MGTTAPFTNAKTTTTLLMTTAPIITALGGGDDGGEERDMRWTLMVYCCGLDGVVFDARRAK